MLREADFLVVACPLTEETRGLLDARRLSLMKPGAFVVNIARGPIVDERALTSALVEGRLAGAALDVYDAEPPPPDHPLRAHDDILLSPHVAGGTGEAQLNITSFVVENIATAMAGKPVRNVVNGLDPVIRRRR